MLNMWTLDNPPNTGAEVLRLVIFSQRDPFIPVDHDPVHVDTHLPRGYHGRRGGGRDTID